MGPVVLKFDLIFFTCKNVSVLLIVRSVCLIFVQNKVVYIIFYFIIIHNILNYFVDLNILDYILSLNYLKNPPSRRQDSKQNLVSRTECCNIYLDCASLHQCSTTVSQSKSYGFVP